MHVIVLDDECELNLLREKNEYESVFHFRNKIIGKLNPWLCSGIRPDHHLRMAFPGNGVTPQLRMPQAFLSCFLN
jgi:hypothetical protein